MSPVIAQTFCLKEIPAEKGNEIQTAVSLDGGDKDRGRRGQGGYKLHARISARKGAIQSSRNLHKRTLKSLIKCQSALAEHETS